MSWLRAACDELLARSRDPKATREELGRIREARIVHHMEITELRQLYVNDTQRAKHDMVFQTIAFDGTNSNTCNCPQTWRAAVRGEAADGTFVPQKNSVRFNSWTSSRFLRGATICQVWDGPDCVLFD